MTEAEWLACEAPNVLVRFARGKAGDRKWRLLAVACCRRIERLLPDRRYREAMTASELYADGRISFEALRAQWDPAWEYEEVPGEGPARECARKAAAEVASAGEGRREKQLLVAIFGKEEKAKAWFAAITDEVLQHVREAVFEEAYEATYIRALDEPSAGAASAPAGDLAARRWQEAVRGARAKEEARAAGDRAAADEGRVQCGLLRDLVGNPFRPFAPDPAWRTWNDGAVPELARAIYDGRAFDRLPVLADSLEDAGCNDAAILAHCRGGGEHVRGCWVVDVLTGRG
jgi:hypothetical protein